MQLWVVNPHALLLALRIELRTQGAVGTYAASHHQTFEPSLRQCAHRLFHQHLDDGRLGAGRHVGQSIGQGLSQTLGLGQHGGFQTRERKVQISTVQQGPGQSKGFGVSLLGQAGQTRTAWVWQAQQFGRFIKSFTRRIVDGFAQ